MRFRKRDTPAVADTGSSDDQQLPIPGYDQLKEKQIGDQLSELSQVDLATIETYERAHASRPAVLEKLRYMRGSEPLEGYDELTPDEIATALAGANAKTVRAVRDYERKFGRRTSVLDEAMRVLPNSRVSADEKQASEQKAALLREGYADRERTAPPPPE